MTPAELFASHRFQDVAGRIDTQSFDPAKARVLTVCNPHPQSFTGIVVFPVSMKWAIDRPLPPIRIFDPITLTDSPLRVDDLRREEGRIVFRLIFSVDSIPALGYKSYVAEYASASGRPLTSGTPSDECAVVESVPSPGALPLTMSFG